MKKLRSITVVFLFVFIPIRAQDNSTARAVDSLLIREDYKKVVDTCRQILSYDSLNPVIYYKMGVAFQNSLEEDKATECFFRAAELDTLNPVYSFKLAKSYFGDNKMKLAEPLLQKLCLLDTLNWIYSFYLTSIYMQSGRYDQALKVYNRFLQSDSSNCTYLDKTAFAYLRKGCFEEAISLFNRSLSIEGKNIAAIKNLSYLYASTSRWDTAVAILGTGMKIDPADMDLYARRAQLFYSRDYTKRAMDDYLVVLASGDTSNLHLKRVGIGYSYNLQPAKAIPYLLLAHKADTIDYETCSYLGQCYNRTGDMKNSSLYYKKTTRILYPMHVQLGRAYSLCADSQREGGYNKDAINNLLKAYSIDNNISHLMTIANIYDERLSDRKNAIIYYKSFLDKLPESKFPFHSDYIEKIRKRLEYLEKETSKKT